jgi:AcrR family transcriptional regulator
MPIAAATSRGTDLPPAKRRQILAGARKAFAELGYERASVDLVAARARVSKATVYNHFHDKRALFVACFSEAADEMREGLRASLGEPEGDLEAALEAAGERLLGVMLSPAILSLYRHTLAEVDRFPEIGQALFERGPAVVYEMIAAWLRRWQEKGALRIDDPTAAAVQFVMLCHADLVPRAQLGVLRRPAEERVRETVRRAVRTFLRAYGA